MGFNPFPCTSVSRKPWLAERVEFFLWARRVGTGIMVKRRSDTSVWPLMPSVTNFVGFAVGITLFDAAAINTNNVLSVWWSRRWIPFTFRGFPAWALRGQTQPPHACFPQVARLNHGKAATGLSIPAQIRRNTLSGGHSSSDRCRAIPAPVEQLHKPRAPPAGGPVKEAWRARYRRILNVRGFL